MDNVCSDNPDPRNPACHIEFTCTSEGIFPDPSDCTVYHYCSEMGGKSHPFKCPSGYVYESKTKLCRRQDSPTFCEVVNCNQTQNAMVLFTPNPAYYAFCMAGPIAPIYMYKCLDELNETYDLTTNRCEYDCPKQGHFIDRTNCNGYVVCTIINGKLTATKSQCPPKHYFNGDQCVREAVACISEILSEDGNY